MNKDKGPKILGAGSPMVDILINVQDEFIETLDGVKGGMELVDAMTLISIMNRAKKDAVLAPGGSAANTIFGLTELGIETAFLGKVGRDDHGSLYTGNYKKMGGDISRFKYNDLIPTGRCLSLVTPDSERTMRTDLGAASTLDINDISVSDFEGISHVHIEGYLLFNRNLIRHILTLSKEASCSVSLDLASFEVVQASKDILPELFKYVDIVFANQDEAKAFCGSEDPVTGLESLLEYCPTVAVKLGKKGALIESNGIRVKVDAELVEAVDTTGAGDLWASGFLYGFLRGKSLKECGEYASIVSSEVVKVMGAAIPDERWTVIAQRVK